VGKKKVRILVVDDIPSVCELLEEVLTHEGFHVDTILTGGDALRLIEEKEYEILILDLNLPDITGLEVMKRVRKTNPELDIIFITGFGTLESAIEALRHEVYDYITKPFMNWQIVSSVKNCMMRRSLFLENRKLYRQLKRYREKLEQEIDKATQDLKNINLQLLELSIRDELTRVYNFRYFKERIQEEVLRATRYKHDVALAIFDIDDFKEFNERYGHQTGNAILAQLGDLLQKNVRKVDIVTRYGGDEFAIIFPHVDAEEEMNVSLRLLDVVGNNEFQIEEKDVSVHITMSAGVATYPRDRFHQDEFIDKADKALFTAKQTGKKQLCAWREVQAKLGS
jgi:diguanylate cyclase (GGDEF)-like protein